MINYDTCKIKEMKKDKCVKCTFEYEERKLCPICKDTKDICIPVQRFINKFLHEDK